MPVKHQLNAPNFVVCARMRMCQIPEYNSYTKRNVIIYFGCRLSANRHSRHSHSLLLVPRSTSSSRSLFAFNNPFICVNTSIFHAILFFSFIIFISFCLFFFRLFLIHLFIFTLFVCIWTWFYCDENRFFDSPWKWYGSVLLLWIRAYIHHLYIDRNVKVYERKTMVDNGKQCRLQS